MTPDTPPVLELRDLSIALPRGADRPHAVARISLVVRRGEILCLVGESGSGKSVIAQAIMGLLPRSLPVSGGTILLEGESLTQTSAARLRALRGTRMAMIFQEPGTALNPVMRCGAQIDELLHAHTMLGAAARRDKILALAGEVALPDPQRILQAYPHQLSGGQRQRVMLAMALALDPALLIADEPTTALDVTTQAQILQLLRDLQARHGMAVLFITHDFGVVAEIAQRVAVLCRGEQVETGATHEVLARPQHAYTRRLIGAVASLAPAGRRDTPAAPPLLSVRGLAQTYRSGGWLRSHRGVVAVDGVSFEIRRGETLGLVGESGCGKTTVARALVRLIAPSAGEIRLGERDLARASPRAMRALRRRVQIVFQDPTRSLNPRRTALDALIEGPLNFGVPRAEAIARARRLLALVRMDPDALARYPHEFSGGERQRLCIARALALEPELLVADEAVSALDVSVQAEVLALLADLRERLHLAILFITHDLRAAAQLCDRVAVMAAGRIVEIGPTSEVYRHPRHAVTRALLAAAPGRGHAFGGS